MQAYNVLIEPPVVIGIDRAVLKLGIQVAQHAGGKAGSRSLAKLSFSLVVTKLRPLFGRIHDFGNAG